MHNQKYLAFLTLVLLAGCITSKSSYDKSVIAYSAKKSKLIEELATYSVLHCFENKICEFTTDALEDAKVRKKFEKNGYGGNVYVTMKGYGNNNSSLIDSTVIFKSITLRGVTEIIYDFAFIKKDFPDDTSNPKDYTFQRVTDRIYYRRRQFPMM